MLPKTIRGPETLATTQSAGLMSAEDKTKLDNLPTDFYYDEDGDLCQED